MKTEDEFVLLSCRPSSRVRQGSCGVLVASPRAGGGLGTLEQPTVARAQAAGGAQGGSGEQGAPPAGGGGRERYAPSRSVTRCSLEGSDDLF